MKIVNKFILFLFSIFIIIVTFITVLDITSFNKSFYKEEYLKLNVYDDIGISEGELNLVTNKLLGYIKDDYGDLEIKANIKGKIREVFNEKEKLHMIDVKVLYKNAINVRNLLLILSIILLGSSKAISKKINFHDIFDSFKSAFIAVIIFVGSLGLYAFLDFYNFWMSFHYIFFTNDLFLLDPSTDILIMMVPGQFFMDLIFKITFNFLLIITLYLLILYFLGRKANDKYRTI